MKSLGKGMEVNVRRYGRQMWISTLEKCHFFLDCMVCRGDQAVNIHD